MQLTKYTKATVRGHYGRAASGITSHIEWMGSNSRFLRNYDVLASRIADIIARRTADPNWDPVASPLSPPLTPAQLQALLNIYDMPARVTNQPQKPGASISFNIGRPPGSEYRWRGDYPSLFGYVETSLAKFDPFYDPDGDGVLSDDEMKAWDPNQSPPPVQNDFRRLDNNGNLKRPVFIAHGSHDVIVSPGETEVYKRLVETCLGLAGARELLAVYYVPGMGHGGAEFNALIGPFLDGLEAWVDYRESGGSAGSLPPDVIVGGLGSYPRE